MKREIITKLLITVLAITTGLEVYADTEANLLFRTVVPKATRITKLTSGPSIVANPETGMISGTLQSVFELDSNDTEGTNEFVITASVDTSAGAVSAYDYWGNIAFTNTEALPTPTVVNEALTHTGDNPNVIVYPVTITASPFKYKFQPGYKSYGYCYRIDLDGETEGTVTHAIDSNPIAGTFHSTKDTSGVYRATITITAVNE